MKNKESIKLQEKIFKLQDTIRNKKIHEYSFTENEKATIALVNLLIDKGVTKTEIYAKFDRSDVTKKENEYLKLTYEKLIKSGRINTFKLNYE